jgi:four helix bundle protein
MGTGENNLLPTGYKSSLFGTNMIKLNFIIMAAFKKFEDIEVWKKSMNLTRLIYQTTNQPSFAKDYNLVNQIRRSSISISSNIAEGVERDGNKELINFLYIAKGSCRELRCQLYIAKDQKYLQAESFQELYNLATEISFSLNKLIKYLQESDYKGVKYK